MLTKLKKYSRSGTRPFASFFGKYRMNCSSDWSIGHSLITESSSNCGTEILLTWSKRRSDFWSVRISLRKSLLSIQSGGKYSCTSKHENVFKQRKTTYSGLGSTERSQTSS